MGDKKRAIDRVEKLLRVAAPDSGATQHERESAALAVVDLILEHSLTVREPEIKTVKIAKHAWVMTIALQYVGCSACGRLISRGDRVWARVRPDDNVEYRHNYLKGCTVDAD